MNKVWANNFARALKTKNRHWGRKQTLPPKKLLTDANIRRFLAQEWTKNYNKKTTQGAKSYISWALKQHRLPGFIREHEHTYLLSWTYLKTLKKDTRWSSYSPNAAGALTQDEVKKIAMAPIRDHRGRLRYDWLRDKVAARCLIHMGWHPKDCHRAKWSMCEEVPDGKKTAIRINGKATKREG